MALNRVHASISALESNLRIRRARATARPLQGPGRTARHATTRERGIVFADHTRTHAKKDCPSAQTRRMLKSSHRPPPAQLPEDSTFKFRDPAFQLHQLRAELLDANPTRPRQRFSGRPGDRRPSTRPHQCISGVHIPTLTTCSCLTRASVAYIQPYTTHKTENVTRRAEFPGRSWRPTARPS